MIEGLPPSAPPPDAGDIDRPEKPCARRIAGPARTPRWCLKPDGHLGDCEGVSRTELPEAFGELGPGRVPGWGR